MATGAAGWACEQAASPSAPAANTMILGCMISSVRRLLLIAEKVAHAGNQCNPGEDKDFIERTREPGVAAIFPDVVAGEADGEEPGDRLPPPVLNVFKLVEPLALRF